MITRVTSPRHKRDFLTYDLEWVPHTMRLRMVGVFDDTYGYRCYESIDTFIDNELTHENRGKWFYAHAGGLADFHFIIHRLKDLGYFSVRGSTSGSSAIIVKVFRLVLNEAGKLVPGKDRWYFVDSYWLLRDSLRNIGKWVGIAKGNEDESVEFYEKADFYTLRDYNEQDCRILHAGIKYFEQAVWDLGGQLMKTQASSAMDLFRRRFLSRDIETSTIVNEQTMGALYASRVEVLATTCADAYYYDVNSSFPYAMTHAQPGELAGTYDTIPDWQGPYIADITITVPEDYLPPLPVRMAGRLFFPFGSWRGWYSNIDIEVLLKSGGRIEKVHECLTFHESFDLKEYSETLYELRRKSEGFPKLAYKYLLNSLYGKFAESAEKSEIIVNPLDVEEGWQMMIPGVFIYEKTVDVPHQHVPIAVHVTAIARRTLYQFMGLSEKLHYCDTDGFSTEQRFSDGDALGAIKLEKYIRKGRFVQAKVYHLDGSTPDGKDAQTVKAKGFSRMNLEKFEKLLNFEEIEYVRMARIKENARRGDFTPREVTVRKGINEDAVGKRHFYPDGSSRPWHFEEIKDLGGGLSVGKLD